MPHIESSPEIGPASNIAEQASFLRKSSKELRADSRRLKLKSIEVNKVADALLVRVNELTIAVDRIAAEF